jgi:MFS family permease
MWIVGIIGGLFFVIASGFAEMWGIDYLEKTHQFSPSIAALAVSMVFAGWAVGSPIYGWLSDRIGRRSWPLVFGGIFAALFMAILLFVPNLSLISAFTLLFLIGLMCGAEALVFAIGRELGPHQLAGFSVAFINMAVMFSGAIAQPLLGYLLDVTNDYQITLFMLPILLLLAAFLAQFVMQETYCEQQDQKHLDDLYASKTGAKQWSPAN